MVFVEPEERSNSSTLATWLLSPLKTNRYGAMGWVLARSAKRSPERSLISSFDFQAPLRVLLDFSFDGDVNDAVSNLLPLHDEKHLLQLTT